MRTNSFFKQILFLISIILFASCDKDYNEIGADIINQNNFNFTTYTSNVVAYNQKIEPIASDNLPVNPLGIYNNPAFGRTIANFATQVQLASVNPTIDPTLNQEIVDVILNIPYFVDATKTVAVSGAGNTYVLDSIYEKVSKAKIKLSVYESGYYMRDLDPDDKFKSAQRFYTNQNTDFDTYKVGSRLNNNSDVAQNDGFFFDPTQHSIITTTTTTPAVTTKTYSAPAMNLKLNADFFKNKILKAPSSELATNDVFKKYFKGLYFKVEKVEGSEGSLNMMDFSKGTITISYKENKSLTDATRVDKSIVLNLSGKTVSLLEQSNDVSGYTTAISTANETEGDERLYLKGGEGALTVIKLFGDIDNFGSDGVTGSPNGVSDELDIIRKNNWLINEANLVFHIDTENTDFKTSFEPQRIYLYDLNNNTPIADYTADATTTTTKKGKTTYDGRLVLDGATSPRGQYYKIRITNHIRNLIKKDSTNVKLGVVVTENINNYTSNKFKSQTGTVKQAPQASVMNPLGTILYGSKSSVPEDKRLKLEIYYTKPN